MSAYTRANRGNCARFKDSSGKELNGVVLVLRSDSMLVGTQSETRPYLYVYDAHLGRDKRVANNTLWVVPYSHVLETYLNAA